MTCGECPDFNCGEPLAAGQTFGRCPHLQNRMRMWRRYNQAACARFSEGVASPVPKSTLSPLLWHLVGAPSAIQGTCIVCGKPATNKHHVIERSDGGYVNGKPIQKPMVTLCGSGTTGCHGRVHDGKLHIDYRDGRWCYLETPRVVGQIESMELQGWKPCKHQEG